MEKCLYRKKGLLLCIIQKEKDEAYFYLHVRRLVVCLLVGYKMAAVRTQRLYAVPSASVIVADCGARLNIVEPDNTLFAVSILAYLK